MIYECNAIKCWYIMRYNCVRCYKCQYFVAASRGRRSRGYWSSARANSLRLYTDDCSTVRRHAARTEVNTYSSECHRQLRLNLNYQVSLLSTKSTPTYSNTDSNTQSELYQNILTFHHIIPCILKFISHFVVFNVPKFFRPTHICLLVRLFWLYQRYLAFNLDLIQNFYIPLTLIKPNASIIVH